MMSDFSGKTINGVTVHNHCAPTAATTIVKYWNNRRGITGLWYSSDWWVFSSLFVNMKTSPTFGTHHDNYYNGFKNYSVNTRGIPYVSCDWWGNSSNEVCTFAKAQGYIDGNFPFKISIAYSDGEGHAIACFGYSTQSGYPQLIFADGNIRGWTFQSFSSLTINNYQYLRW